MSVKYPQDPRYLSGTRALDRYPDSGSRHQEQDHAQQHNMVGHDEDNIRSYSSLNHYSRASNNFMGGSMYDGDGENQHYTNEQPGDQFISQSSHQLPPASVRNVDVFEHREMVVMRSTNGMGSSMDDGVSQISIVDDQSVISEGGTSHYSNYSKPPEIDVTETDRYGFFSKDNVEQNPANSSPETPLQVLRKREQKWLEMFENWPDFMNKQFPKVKSRCRKGIPPSLRSRAWQYLSGAHHQMSLPHSHVLWQNLDAAPGDPISNDDIRKDLDRQFPNHELFSRHGTYGKFGQSDLFRLLKAWTSFLPEEGYCQAQAPVAATLLMHMPLEEAFHCFLQICTKYVPGYYSQGLEAVQLDGAILNALLKSVAPSHYKLLKKHSVDPSLYMIEWFMCIFCRTLPWPTVLRVWDMFFCEGIKILQKVGLVLLRYGIDRNSCKDMFETVECLKNIPPAVTHVDFLLPKMSELRLTDEDFEKEHYRQVKIRRKQHKNEQLQKARKDKG